jgi:hypothetical protein
MKRNIRRANPVTFGAMITARQGHSSAKSDDITTKLCSAFEGLKADSSDEKLFDLLASTLNAAMIRAKSIDELCLAQLQAAADALRRCDVIRAGNGRYGLDGRALHATAAGFESCEKIIRTSSPKQLFDAFAESAAASNTRSR